jgi:hypothetical protein
VHRKTRLDAISAARFQPIIKLLWESQDTHGSSDDFRVISTSTGCSEAISPDSEWRENVM